MIRRISKNNDLKDLIKSCPSGVIDDIIEIRYFISGHPETEIVATFEKVGSHLEVILPTSELSTLSNGVLMRRALYKVSDPAYPDGYYNLEFVDNMNVWLGDEETEDPFDPGYLTEGDLKTINGESLVGVGNIEISVPDYYATKSWVSSNFLSTIALTGYATESWVSSQNFLTSTSLAGYATESWVSSQGYLTSVPSEYATKSWVSSNFLSATALTGYATESWVSSNYVSTTTLSSYTTFTDIDSYISSFWYRAAEEFYSEYVPRSEVGSYLTGYATESWVQSQGYLTSVPSEYATQSWVSSNFLSSTALTGYATESWVSSQFLEASKIWTGTSSQWAQLTPEQQAFYTIALVTE